MVDFQQARDKAKEAAKLRNKFNVEIDTRTAREVIDDFRKRGIFRLVYQSRTPAPLYLYARASGAADTALDPPAIPSV